MMKAIVVAAILLAALVSSKPVCHNITGTCGPQGFTCVGGEVVPYEQRCNGVEDCSDGTDEFMCDHADSRPIAERTAEERQALEEGQASCVNCNCMATSYSIFSTSPWWNFATVARTDLTLMSGSGLPCKSSCVSMLNMGFYRKNRICRGFLCCIRQRGCGSCTSACPSKESTRCY